ncbi:MAG TPA: SH3 domain-containing protein, partial [Gemmatimonadales bacterium]|nr:SH3 domain-containing protein [Gemmatimonadales bacterium]
PGGTRLGRLAPGIEFSASAPRNGHVAVALEGWIFRGSLDRTSRDGHHFVTNQEENLRELPNGRLRARLFRGVLLDSLERRGGWVRVRRQVWVAASGLERVGATAARTPATPPAAERPRAAPQRDTASAAPAAATDPDPRRGVSRRRLNLYRAPDSAAVGSIEAGLPVRITSRAGPWVRIEVQGWVRESEVRLSDANILTNVSAAELRGAPDEFRGRLLRWTIQFLALQTADELRPDFTPGQRYILARGPAPEYAFVYVIVPAAKLAEVQRLEPLASVTIVARVVNGRSAYLANPILELVELQ